MSQRLLVSNKEEKSYFCEAIIYRETRIIIRVYDEGNVLSLKRKGEVIENREEIICRETRYINNSLC